MSIVGIDGVDRAAPQRASGPAASAHRSDHAGRVRAAQIGAVMRFTPMVFVINLLNATLVSIVVYGQASLLVLGVWCGTLVVVLSLGLRAWLLRRARGARPTASARAIRRSTVHAGCLAALWGVVPAVWFPSAGVQEQLVIGTVTTGMICGGGFALATVARAASTYVVVLTGGALLGLALSSGPHVYVLAALVTLYSATVLRSVRGTAQLFEKQVLAEIELRERGQVIELLLSEFEENASDWLFEVDIDGRLTKASSRFAIVSGRALDELSGLHMSALLAPASAGALQRAIEGGRPFRDLEVETADPSGARWWLLSAGPIRDDGGAIAGWRGVGSDITETKIARDRIAYLASTDTLTDLPNRPRFLEQATAAIARAHDAGVAISIACLDLDEFKQVNDTLGHPVGDRLLQVVAADLRSWAGEDVLVGRFGGDEFGLLFPANMPVEAVMERSRRLISRLSHAYDLAGQEAKVSASIGVAVTTSASDDVHELLRRADFALYCSKHSGRAAATLYCAKMQQSHEEARRLQDDLADAIARDELAVAYQPIVDVRTGEVAGFEALLRWTHPVHGQVPPSRFIPIAERSGLIVPIGEWVLRTACAEAARWPDKLWVSVNVSPVQIGKSDVARTVLGALEAAGLAPNRLEIEITETVFIAHEQDTLALIGALRAAGVGIALDDFGTGYSSLSYLDRFPIDKLKIDRSFVEQAGTAPKRTAILAAIIALARGLGIRTTAEGVEGEAALTWLGLAGCDLAQGYLFAKPMARSEVAPYLAASRRPGSAEGKAA